MDWNEPIEEGTISKIHKMSEIRNCDPMFQSTSFYGNMTNLITGLEEHY